MAALVLNQSIDEIEFQPISMSGNIGNFNDLNSVVEYISEIVLGHKDTFPEFQKDGSHKQSVSYKHIYPKTFNLADEIIEPFQPNAQMDFSFPLDEKYSFLFSKEIIQPPSFF